MPTDQHGTYWQPRLFISIRDGYLTWSGAVVRSIHLMSTAWAPDTLGILHVVLPRRRGRGLCGTVVELPKAQLAPERDQHVCVVCADLLRYYKRRAKGA